LPGHGFAAIDDLARVTGASTAQLPDLAELEALEGRQ
jgi:hypothetical protein